MATAQHVTALIKSHAAGDDERFYTIALQLAAKEARAGNEKYAEALKALVDEGRGRRRSSKVVPVASPKGDLAQLVTASYPKVRRRDMAVDPVVRDALDRVLQEQGKRSELRAHGLEPSRKLLLVGPPGTGKTMTASVLATELALPLFAVRLDGLLTKFMGETAAKLRLVFDAMAETRGVYLFDEVDALAGTREATNDVGEIRRVLNSFLQFLDQERSDSVIVATSNLPQLLDRALFRRFDLTVEYGLPTVAVAKKVIRGRLAAFDTGGITKTDWAAVGRATKGLNHADISSAAEQAAKQAVLSGSTEVAASALLNALDDRQPRSAR